MKLPPGFLALTLALGFALPSHAANEPGEPWVLSSHRDDVTIFSRLRPGSNLKEFKAVGMIDAPPSAVLEVLDDVDAYTRFMPYVVECRIIKRDAGSTVSYQRIAPPFCSDRDYTLQVQHETRPSAAGPTFVCRWELANALGPSERADVIRVKVDEGSWTLEPAGNRTTRAIYQIYTDSGGSLPVFIANKANQIAIGKLYQAVRGQAAKAK